MAREDGPGDAILKLRARLGDGQLGRLADCFHCLSLWVAAPLAAWSTRRHSDRVVTWLAASGGACLLERFRHEDTTTALIERPDQEGM